MPSIFSSNFVDFMFYSLYMTSYFFIFYFFEAFLKEHCVFSSHSIDLFGLSFSYNFNLIVFCQFPPHTGILLSILSETSRLSCVLTVGMCSKQISKPFCLGWKWRLISTVLLLGPSIPPSSVLMFTELHNFSFSSFPNLTDFSQLPCELSYTFR